MFITTRDALHRKIAFAMAINGGPGSGKSRILVESLIALVRSDIMMENKTPIKILVTSATDASVDYLANELLLICNNSAQIPTGMLNFYIENDK